MAIKKHRVVTPDPFVTPSPKKKLFGHGSDDDDTALLASAKKMAPIPAKKKELKDASAAFVGCRGRLHRSPLVLC
eukprot:7211987-Pyramimonas_sp.AAC.1